jgi:excinuclease UvrABC ATPase subunit
MAKQYIKIRGANEHNLKNISIDIPRNELVVLTGLSGSGKSSLTRSMPKGSGGIWSPCRLMRVSS